MERTLIRARLRARGQLTLPNPVRRALGAAVGDEIAFIVTDSGQVAIRRLPFDESRINPEQVWFWTERQQDEERVVDEELAAGRVLKFGGVEELIAYLDAPDDAATPD